LQGGIKTEKFDAVVCCVGIYHDPNLPQVTGMENFPGKQLHCHNYRRNKSFKGEAVLVVGASFSGLKLISQFKSVLFMHIASF
jgi:cation diffusion facilitator CzcD-associated flavoprotein CzcO